MGSNLLYFGDNLKVLREHVADESVDLIYLDPPFNSKANYNVLYKEVDGTPSAAQIRAFSDFWLWDETTARTYHELLTDTRAPADNVTQLRRDDGVISTSTTGIAGLQHPAGSSVTSSAFAQT